jgi:TolA-binding protein
MLWEMNKALGKLLLILIGRVAYVLGRPSLGKSIETGGSSMNRYLPVLLAALLGLAWILAACEKKEEKAPPKVSFEDVKKQTQEAVETAVQFAKQERDEFIQKAQKDLDALNGKLEELKKQAQGETGEAKDKMDRQIKNLQEQQQVAEKKLSNLKSATGDAWKDLKTGTEAAIDSIRKSF